MELIDINTAKKSVELKYDFPEFELDSQVKDVLEDFLKSRKYSIRWYKYSGYIKSSKSKYTYFSNQSLLWAKKLLPFKRVVDSYKKTAIDVFKDIDADMKDVMTLLKGGIEQFNADVNTDIKFAILTAINEYFDLSLEKLEPTASNTDFNQLLTFLTDYKSWGGGKTIDRGDYINSSLTWCSGLLHETAVVIFDPFIDAIDSLPEELLERINSVTPETSDTVIPTHKGNNIIHYGAAGTGKSHSLKSSPNIIRTVFHMDTLNSDFVGAYKPYKSGNNITYKFVEGPFIKAFIEATKHPDKEFNLIIEEINRADCGAVFGEIFQLLDRQDNGESEYRITVDKSLDDFLTEELNPDAGPNLWHHELCIPSNLNIRATMNSSDQGVQPMDSAFKRRWQFKHHCIDFSLIGVPDKILSHAGEEYSWRILAESINSILMKAEINEDRLIGPFFLKGTELSINSSICGKLFIYLWDDVLRHGRRELIFNTSEYPTFTKLSQAYLENKNVFSDELKVQIRSTKQKSEEADEEAAEA